MKTFRLVAVAMVLLVGIAGIWANAADAKDAKGCEGLGDYRKEMFEAGRDYLAGLDKDGIPPSRDILTYSSEDWDAFAKAAADYGRAMKDIEPPAFAKDWHQAQVEWTGLIEQVGKAAASGGVMVTIGFSDALDKNEQAKIEALNQAATVCADFPSFRDDWDALDGSIDGTPVATPTD